MPSRTKSKAAPKRTRPVRTDLYIDNETTAIVIADASMLGAEIEVGGRTDACARSSCAATGPRTCGS